MTFSRASLLPAVPVPPHDPRSLRLDGRTGWRIGSSANVAIAADGCGGSRLTLAPLPIAAASIAAPDGSFGGVTWPDHLTEAPDGGLFLLDRVTGLLKRFDGCACRFRTIPATGGPGPGPRQFDAPGGIASCGEMLLVADTGNRRVSVFSFFGYALRAHWSPPAGATAAPWTPVDLARSGAQILVTDPANGALHVFNGGGRWLGHKTGMGAIRHVAVDRHGRIYVLCDGEDFARVLAPWPGLEETGRVTRSEIEDGAFARLPIRFGTEGSVDLSGYCTTRDTPRYFDPSGNALPEGEGAVEPAFFKSGTATIGPLDSRVYRCLWDRVAMGLKIPGGGRVRILALSAEVERTQTEIDGLPDADWVDMPAFRDQPDTGKSDVLLRADPGRFLWLRLILSGDGSATPEIAWMTVDFPRISLRRYLPGVFGEEPVSADFTDRFLALFDRGFRDIEHRIDHIAELFDPLSAPAAPGKSDFLSWLAGWIDVTLDRRLPLRRRRLLLKSAGKLFRLRGTKSGLRQTLELYLGLAERQCRPRQPCCGPCTTEPPRVWSPPGLILEHFTLRRWLFVGAGRLGDNARLWGERIVNRTKLGNGGDDGAAQLGATRLDTINDPHRDPFHVYAHRFSVFLPGWIRRLPGRERLVERLIRAESPAHAAANLEWVEPRFRVGVQSMIGFDAVIGCYPQGVTLGSDTLGRGTVLPSGQGRDRPLRLGRTGRIGTSAL